MKSARFSSWDPPGLVRPEQVLGQRSVDRHVDFSESGLVARQVFGQRAQQQPWPKAATSARGL